jgi:hypothetical protein
MIALEKFTIGPPFSGEARSNFEDTPAEFR